MKKGGKIFGYQLGAGTALLSGIMGEEAGFPLRKGQNFDSAFALHEPEIYFQYKKSEAKGLGIDPPKSSEIEDMLEYETRASKRREEFVSGRDYNKSPEKIPWEI